MEELSRKELLLCSLNRQYLLEKGERMQVVGELLGLQAQFAQNPGYALRIRAKDFELQSWEQGLVKIWSHRGTIHVARQDQLGLLLSARGANRQWVDGRWGLSAAIQARWAAFLLEQVKQGVERREELKQACRQAGMAEDLLEKVFYGWGGLLKEMCDRGMLVYHSGMEKRFILPGPIGWIDRPKRGQAGGGGAIFPNLRSGDFSGLRRLHRLEEQRNTAFGWGAASRTHQV